MHPVLSIVCRLRSPAGLAAARIQGRLPMLCWAAIFSSFVATPCWLAQAAPDAGGTKPMENTLGMRFVNVPGVWVLFSTKETRVCDYRVYAEDTQREWAKSSFEQTPDDPAVNVSWEDAVAFCNWLTTRERKEGRLKDTQHYRLPTDHEWSVAVGLGPEQGRTPEERLRTSVVWPWGCTWPPGTGDGNYSPELEADTFANTSPVGSFRPNRHGLFDMGGNVWEWCDDWYNDASVTKALRGGSFHDSHPKDLLAAYRFSGTMHLSHDDIGFRVVLQDDSLPEASPNR